MADEHGLRPGLEMDIVQTGTRKERGKWTQHTVQVQPHQDDHWDDFQRMLVKGVRQQKA
jgi:hypothetical protein